MSSALQNEILRYNRVQLCVTGLPTPEKTGRLRLVFPEEPNPRIERVKFQLRATGVKPESASALNSGIHTRGYLPHVKREGSRYFVTFRLADSLPREVLLKIQANRAERLHRIDVLLRTPTDPRGSRKENSVEEVDRDYYRQLEWFLDRGSGECWLRRTEVADVIAGALRFFQGDRYLLDAWVVMPNHVHAVLWPIPNHTLTSVLQTWKRFTSREVNKLLGRTGERLWQPESFDHWIRNDEEHARCCRYVINNPVKARLCETARYWRWSSAWQGALPL